MGKVILHLLDRFSDTDEIRIDGDFEVGRYTLADGPMFAVAFETGKMEHFSSCSMTVSRLTIGPTGDSTASHARFFWRKGKLFVQDMGSSNGTFLNGNALTGWKKKKVSEPVEVRSMARIAVGKFEFDIQPVSMGKEAGPGEVDVEGLTISLPKMEMDLSGALVQAYQVVSEEFPPQMLRVLPHQALGS